MTPSETNHSGAGEVTWNFQKYLIDKDGNIVKTYNPQTEPNSPELQKDIEALI